MDNSDRITLLLSDDLTENGMLANGKIGNVCGEISAHCGDYLQTERRQKSHRLNEDRKPHSKDFLQLLWLEQLSVSMHRHSIDGDSAVTEKSQEAPSTYSMGLARRARTALVILL